MSTWQRDALAAGFHLKAIALLADFVAGGVVTVDGPPIEVLPGYWVIPGFLPYDGLVILAALDRRQVVKQEDPPNHWKVARRGAAVDPQSQTSLQVTNESRLPCSRLV